MSIRLQVLVPEALDARLHKAAQRSRMSQGAWVRQAIGRALADERTVPGPVARLASLGGPTGDIDQILAEIDAGRSR
jgi:hypothetical protein